MSVVVKLDVWCSKSRLLGSSGFPGVLCFCPLDMCRLGVFHPISVDDCADLRNIVHFHNLNVSSCGRGEWLLKKINLTREPRDMKPKSRQPGHLYDRIYIYMIFNVTQKTIEPALLTRTIHSSGLANFRNYHEFLRKLRLCRSCR